MRGAAMNEIKVFAFRDEYDIRVMNYGGQPYFALTDVCKTLDLKNAAQAKEALDDDEFTVFQYKYTGKNGKTMENRITIISESGLYSLIFRSRKPFAKTFRKWVTAEVLPAIRRENHYEISSGDKPHEKTVLETVVDMIRNINQRIIAREDIPASVLKYVWNMANITKEFSRRKPLGIDLLNSSEDTSELAEDFIDTVTESLKNDTSFLPGTLPIDPVLDAVFIRTEAVKYICRKIGIEHRELETVRMLAASGLLPRLSAAIKRYPHHDNGIVRRKSGIMWNMSSADIRIIDLIDGKLMEICKD